MWLSVLRAELPHAATKLIRARTPNLSDNNDNNNDDAIGGLSIPAVTITTGLATPDGREESLTEYICDHPGCPNIATHVLGCVREISLGSVVCDEHIPRLGTNFTG
jgi:hypothetical protein